PRQAEALESRASDDPSWTVHRVAVGDEAGDAELHVAATPLLDSLLPASEVGLAQYSDLASTRSEHVGVARLREGLATGARGAQRVFLKVDTQGFDLRVLRGAAGVRDRIVAIHVELVLRSFYEGGGDYIDVLTLLREWGFAPVEIVSGATHRGLLAEADCLLR